MRGGRRCFMSLFFFFQAEDGIRDLYVTGVQTCALPIYFWKRSATSSWSMSAGIRVCSRFITSATAIRLGVRRIQESRQVPRSEERRVGKECRARGSPAELKKKR